MRKTGWIAFSLWAVPGVVAGLQVSAIGVLLLPFGLVVIVLLAKVTRIWPEVLGIFEGSQRSASWSWLSTRTTGHAHQAAK